MRTIIASLTLLVLLAAPAAAADRLVEQEQVLAIEIPVQVLRDGEPVRGLGPENFEISVKGKKLELSDFEIVDLNSFTPQRMESAPPPISARRHFLFFFDLTFSEVGPVIRARGAVDQLLNELHPTDLVGVAVYSTIRGPQLVLGFSSDHEQVRQAVATLGVPDLIEGSLDPLRLTLVDPQTLEGRSDLFNLQNREPESAGAQVLAEVSEAVTEHYAAIDRQNERTSRRDRRAKVQNLTKDFSNLARLMGAIRGRKYVVYLSEGFDADVLFATADRGETNRMNRASETGQIWEIDSDQRFGDESARSALTTMLEEFRRSDCVIQAVNIGAAGPEDTASGGRGGSDVLFIMANETGGEFYNTTNKLTETMTSILKRTSVTYNLVVQPEGIKPDGKYYKLKIKLRDVPKGAQLVHRPGFYAPGSAARNRLQDQLSAGTLILAGREMGTLPVEVLSAAFPTSGANAQVTVLVEIDGFSLSRAMEQPQLPAEIYGYAIDEKQRIRGFFGQQITLDLDKVGEFVSQNGIKYYGEMELPPGDYSLRVLVRNPENGAMAVRVRPLSVPAYGEGAVLLSPMIPDAQGRWLLLRNNAKPSEHPFPFMAGDTPFMPGAFPEVAPGRPSPLYLIGFGLPREDLVLRGKLIDASGATVADGVELDVQRRTRGAVPGSQVIVAQASIAEKLAAGDYTLELQVGGTDRGASIPLRVLAR